MAPIRRDRTVRPRLRQLGVERLDIIDRVPDWFLGGHPRRPTGWPPGRPTGARDIYHRSYRQRKLTGDDLVGGVAREEVEHGAVELRGPLAGSPDWEVIDQDPVRIPDADVPQPDVAVVRPMTRAALASAAAALLVVEVSDTTLADDLGRKRRLYGSAGVPTYWVADVNGRVLHRFAETEGGDYRVYEILTAEMAVRVPGAAGEAAAVRVSAFFP